MTGGTGNVNILQLLGSQTVGPLNLRNDLVTTAGDVETIDVVSTDHSRQVATDLLQIETEHGYLIAIDDEFTLGLIDFDVNNRRKQEHAALHGFELQLLSELQDLLGVGCGGQNEFYRKVAATRQGRRRDREHADAGDAAQLLLDLRHNLKHGALALFPGLGHQTTKAGGRGGELKGEVRLRNAEKNIVGRRGVATGLIQGGIGRGFKDAENDPLVLARRQFHR